MKASQGTGRVRCLSLSHILEMEADWRQTRRSKTDGRFGKLHCGRRSIGAGRLASYVTFNVKSAAAPAEPSSGSHLARDSKLSERLCSLETSFACTNLIDSSNGIGQRSIDKTNINNRPERTTLLPFRARQPARRKVINTFPTESSRAAS